MDEVTLLKLWNQKRNAVISAQLTPTLMLIGVLIVAGFNKFDGATNEVKYLAVGLAGATGILAIISQYAAIREAEALLIDLKRLSSQSELTKKIADSRGLLSLSAIAIVCIGLVVFALVTFAVFGAP
jgi:hypothetical protein